jgi:hypothetical protein
LKLEHSPVRNPRAGWQRSVNEARRVLDDKLTATLRHDVTAELPRLWVHARRDALLGLIENGETETAKALPPDLPYSLDQLRNEHFLPANIHGIVDEVL